METKKTPIYKRVKIGRPAKFPTAEDLWREALAYFDWCDDNPITTNNKRKKSRSEKNGDGQTIEQEPVSRPYTLDGLCLWCNILTPWATFKRDCGRRADAEQFAIVINACEQCVRDQQVTGAMIGIYSERLTARLNGITDKQELEVNSRQTNITFDEYVRMLRGENIDS